jgi:hypothetical protein
MANLDTHIETEGWIDPETLAVLRDIAEARCLPPSQTQYFVRAVAGAVRPNRDRPIWDLCWLVRVLAARSTPATARGSAHDQLVALLLSDDALNAIAAADGGQRLHPQARALLAFADFILSHEDCRWFADMRAAFGAVADTDPAKAAENVVRDAVAMISQRLRRFRVDRFAYRQHEETVRSLAAFMGGRGRAGVNLGQFDDADVLAYWEHRLSDGLREGRRMMFKTAVQHCLAFRAVLRQRASERVVASAIPFDPSGTRESGGPEDDIDAEDPFDAAAAADTLSAAGVEELAAMLVDGLPDDVKVLTGAERERLGDLVALHDFTRELPLTVLRTLSFGAVQSGIANRLRRGIGGPSVEARTLCHDAETYSALLSTYDRLARHVEKLMLIAGHLARPEHDDAVVGELQRRLAEDGARALKKMQRAGFDGDRRRLADLLTGLANHLLALRDLLATFRARADRLDATRNLDARFGEDRNSFARQFARAYLAAGPKEIIP